MYETCFFRPLQHDYLGFVELTVFQPRTTMGNNWNPAANSGVNLFPPIYIYCIYIYIIYILAWVEMCALCVGVVMLRKDDMKTPIQVIHLYVI